MCILIKDFTKLRRDFLGCRHPYYPNRSSKDDFSSFLRRWKVPGTRLKMGSDEVKNLKDLPVKLPVSNQVKVLPLLINGVVCLNK